MEEEVVVQSIGAKREVVSISNAVSFDLKHFYPSYTTTVSSCKRCLKERSKGNNRWRQKPKKREKFNKSNTPIVIPLKDTLKAALNRKQRSLADTLLRAKKDTTDTDSKSSESDAQEEIISPKEIKTKKDVKNLSALISVLEKSHQKDTYSATTNLSKNSKKSYSKFVANYVLNNSYILPESNDKPRSIGECDNVDVICNDLNSSEKSSITEESESDNGSVVSSSEIQSDSDLSSTHQETTESEFTKDELEQLARYTTGCPLIRYDCPPADCPQCQSDLYQLQYYCNTLEEDPKSKEIHQVKTSEISQDVQEQAECSAEITSSNTSTPEFQGNSTYSALSRKRNPPNDNILSKDKNAQTKKQLLDIDIAKKENKSGTYLYPDSVFIDLTDTDVTFTVYYNHNYPFGNQTNDFSYANSQSTYPLMSYSSTTMSYMAMSPYWYWPYMYPPMYNLSSPLYMATDTSTIPKTLMIPPEELSSFNSTAPPERQWMFLSPPDKTKATATFTVMCYNVLCDKYCTRQLYGYCPSWALNWDFRKKGIMDEIKHYGADIICLQEVETDQFYNFFLPDLKAIGYDGIFSAKSRARTMTESERKHVDGCAIFYRTNKFTLVKEHLIEFNKLAMANAEGSDDMLNRVMTKDNIGLAALLETKEGAYENVHPQENQIRQPVMVSTAHIHWDPEFSDVKLIQTMMLVNELKKITEETIQSYKLGTTDVNSIPLIMCGDLNSLPDSGVVEYLVSGKVANNHIDFKEISYEEILHRICVKNEKDILSHDFRLNKAYDDIMPFTNYTYDFKGVIDYIFYSREHFNLLGMLGPLDEGWFRQNKVVGCPHPHIPSDHFSLLVDIEMSLPFPSGRTANGPVSHR
ncbi:CCR4 [Mytilus edulis]|uniref:poly(A)-specific ribonuclease n=1 Tax=Mytilus edulis TaxID=6550 RepID=A0A8S3S9R9_MYTED|nr:CCR4 [Mytilus edulis]